MVGLVIFCDDSLPSVNFDGGLWKLGCDVGDSRGISGFDADTPFNEVCLWVAGRGLASSAIGL